MLPTSFRPGQPWLDTGGRPINAHGGCVLHHAHRYYWYGEERPAGPDHQDAPVSVSCYSSRDLYSWQHEGTVLSVDHTSSTSPLATGCKIERPRVVYNSFTQKFVLWWQHHRKGFLHLAALAGVAVSDSPTGPFRLVAIRRVNGAMFRDCNVFQDDDGSAHLIFATDDNTSLAICRLTDDYLAPTPVLTRHFSGRYVAAPCVFKHAGLYHLIASDCSGWYANEARSANAPSLLGPWRERGNPCLGNDAEIAYGCQSTFIFTVPGKPGAFLLMADRWHPENLAESTYVWLPVFFKRTVPCFPIRPLARWHDEWSLSIFDQAPYSVPVFCS